MAHTRIGPRHAGRAPSHGRLVSGDAASRAGLGPGPWPGCFDSEYRLSLGTRRASPRVGPAWSLGLKPDASMMGTKAARLS